MEDNSSLRQAILFLCNPSTHVTLEFYMGSLHLVLFCLIVSIIFSDHTSVVLDHSIKGARNRVKNWRLNPNVLKDHSFISNFNTKGGGNWVKGAAGGIRMAIRMMPSLQGIIR